MLASPALQRGVCDRNRRQSPVGAKQKTSGTGSHFAFMPFRLCSGQPAKSQRTSLPHPTRTKATGLKGQEFTRAIRTTH